ncbi:MAG: peptide chain release factor 2 [Gemmatimonadetes bacterium]|nr:peptide chain release factor 2 [Gemmatimonadota bacterium]MBT7861949.1 peptide chain release factor 2 [Gemmatimonadota bacterium]
MCRTDALRPLSGRRHNRRRPCQHLKNPSPTALPDSIGSGGIFDIEARTQELTSLDEEMAGSDFWNDRRRAEEVTRRARELRDLTQPWGQLRSRVDDLAELHELSADENDAETLSDLEKEVADVTEALEKLEFYSLLSDEDDPKDAILVIHSGAGGTEAADWAEMLMRMYGRWIERQGFTSEMMDLQPGDEAGIKGATIEVKGSYAYGYLKAEAGVHRLVRISPFDANKRRHTSFASVFIYPDVDAIPDVELRDEDLQIDVYKAGGAGGQHVNKTSSAVRITHLPTGITVNCQNERSQLKNKGTALKVLTARLYDHYKQEEKKKMEVVESTKKSIDFGSQIRSYVFQPYQLVKDHRTGHESGNVQAVMDGDLDGFIQAFLSADQSV